MDKKVLYPHVIDGKNAGFFIESADQFYEKYDSVCVENDSVAAPGSNKVVIAGRVWAKRVSSSKLLFVDIKPLGVSKNKTVQIKLQNNADWKSSDDNFSDIKRTISMHDWWAFTGVVCRTKAGQLSVAAESAQLLAPCASHVPDRLTDEETRHRNRPLDLIVNDESIEVLLKRSAIIAAIRDFCTRNLGLVEVETPTLQLHAGGASAKPFETFHNALKLPMYMRVAPELYLKMLIVGGLPGVFEIGKNFRNEDIDRTHNPEFTAIELYWPWHDYMDLMDMTEQMLREVAKKIGFEDLKVTTKNGKTIDFSKPFGRIRIMDELFNVYLKQADDSVAATVEWRNGVDDLESEEARAFFDGWCVSQKIEVGEPRTTPRLLDKLIGEYIEPKCEQPTFLMEHPQIMCPLAKYHRDRKQLTERFELFIGGLEYANAYTELNDPGEQRRQFGIQAKASAGDEEAQLMDEDFCKALDLGLPPTAGWGMGIDRLVMLLTGKDSIRDVVAFPAMKPIANDKPTLPSLQTGNLLKYHAHYQKRPSVQDAIAASPKPCDADKRVIAIRRETKNNWEGRCALSPAHVRELVKGHGINVHVQRSATRAFSDLQYEAAGAVLVDEITDEPVVLGLKELPVGHMHANRMYLCFSHTFKGQPEGAYRIDAMARHNITLIDYELIRDEAAFRADVNTGARAMKFGPYAGYGGVIDTFHGVGLRLIDREGEGYNTPFMHMSRAYSYPTLEDARLAFRRVGDEIKTRGLPDALLPFTVAFVSKGAVAANALELFQHTQPIFIEPEKWATVATDRPIEEQRKSIYYSVFTHEHLVQPKHSVLFNKEKYYQDAAAGKAKTDYEPVFADRVLPYSSVIINGAYWDDRFHRFVTIEQAKRLSESGKNKLIALGDLGCDIRGPFEFFSHSTRIADPFYYYNMATGEEHDRRDDPSASTILIYGVDHIPGELAADATQFFGDRLLPFIPMLVAHDQSVPYDSISDLPPHVMNAMQTRHGQIVGRYSNVVNNAIAAHVGSVSAEKDAADLKD